MIVRKARLKNKFSNPIYSNSLTQQSKKNILNKQIEKKYKQIRKYTKPKNELNTHNRKLTTPSIYNFVFKASKHIIF